MFTAVGLTGKQYVGYAYEGDLTADEAVARLKAHARQQVEAYPRVVTADPSWFRVCRSRRANGISHKVLQEAVDLKQQKRRTANE